MRRHLNQTILCLLAAAAATFSVRCYADVPTPTPPPPVPAGYCSTIYNELWGDLQAFNQLLAVPPQTWTPVSGPPPLMAANLQVADANTGPNLGGPNYMPTVTTQLQEEQALGVNAIMVQVGFPMLYEPFFGSQEAMQQYVTFYTQVAQAIHAAGMKLIVENDVLLSDDIDTGWSNLNSFYATLNWTEYMAARAQGASMVAQTMQPDYLVLAEEPDGEAKQANQPNMNNPQDAAQMIAGEISAVQALNLPNTQIGAGFGTWLNNTGTSSLMDYLTAYLALPLNYIDFHLYPINTEAEGSFIDNTLTVASNAALAGKPVAMSEGWVWKMENSEWDVLNGQDYRGRDPFSFWAPLDQYYQQTVQALGNYANMLYVAPEGPDYLFVYQTYGGTTANGGASNCTCTTQSCSDYTIVHVEEQLANTANSLGDYTTTGVNYYGQIVQTPDTTAPSVPANVTGAAGTTQATTDWAASTDNIGVVGYNVLRCNPPALGQPCTAVYVGQTTGTQYTDTNLNSNTYYTYQVQAFDLANNNSGLSLPVTVLTMRTSADSPTSLTATAVSPKEISLKWTPPATTNGLSKYLIFSGPTPGNMTQIGYVGASTTTYNANNLTASTLYYFGVESVESGYDSPMSPTAFATTLPLPSPPSNLAGVPTPTTIALTWQEFPVQGGLPVTTYKVSMGTSPGVYTETYTVKSTNYTARSLTAATTYYFQVVAVDSSYDDSPPTAMLPVTTLPMPPAPTNLTATTPAATQIALTWQWAPLPGGLSAARYLVFCGTSVSNMPQVATVTSMSYTYRSAQPNTEYWCAVEAVDTSNDDSPQSEPIDPTTPPNPAPPANVTATAVSDKKVTVTWTETIPPNGLQISSYQIYRGNSSSNLTKLPNQTTQTTFNDTTVAANTTYYYAVVATDSGHDASAQSPVSAPVTTP